MYTSARFFISLAFILILVACKKEETEINTPVTSSVAEVLSLWTPAQTPVTGIVTGIITNSNEEIVEGATVTLAGQTAQTNAAGFFSFIDVPMNGSGTFVRVEKEGFFPGSRRFFPRDDSNNEVLIQLMEKSFSDTFSSTDGINLALLENPLTDIDREDNPRVSVPADGLIYEADGNPFSGTAKIAFKYLSPTAESTLTRMPGNLQGVAADGNEMSLKTVGMMAVEIESASGEKLNLDPEKGAVLSFPVPEGANDLPGEIPLWSYAEDAGIWVEQGTATLQNGVYVGTVYHFSFWNCDVPFNSANVCVQIVNGENPISGVIVYITSSALVTGTGVSDNEGFACGAVPAEEVLTLQIIKSCTDTLFSQTIGPFALNSDNELQIDISDVQTEAFITSFFGFITDCNGNPLTNGLVKVFNENQTYIIPSVYTDNQGMFLSEEITCTSHNFYLEAWDFENQQKGEAIPLVFGESNELGEVAACGIETDAGLVTFTVNGVTKNYLPEWVLYFSNQNRTTVFVYDDNRQIEMAFHFEGTTAGNYSGEANACNRVEDFGLNWRYQSNLNTGPFHMENFVVSEYNEDIITGPFNGEIIHSVTGEVHDVECTFTVPAPEG